MFNSLRLSDPYMRHKTHHHWFRLWLVAWLAPSHYLNQCWNIVNLNLRNKFRWNLKRNSCIFVKENAFENVVYEMAFILSRPQCVNIDFSNNYYLLCIATAKKKKKSWWQCIDATMICYTWYKYVWYNELKTWISKKKIPAKTNKKKHCTFYYTTPIITLDWSTLSGLCFYSKFYVK